LETVGVKINGAGTWMGCLIEKNRMTKTIIYIDPGYKIDLGHYKRMGGLFKEEATASHAVLQHYVSLNVPIEIADEMGLIRRFKYLAGLPWIEEPGEALSDFHMRLDEIFQDMCKKESLGPYELFMYTAHPLHLPIIAFLLNKYRSEIRGLSAHICFFYLDPDLFNGGDGSDEYKVLLKRVARLIELFDPHHMMTVCTDSERTERLYGPFFKRQLKVLPLPVERTSSVSLNEEAVAPGTLTIGYIGQTTKRAGYDLVYHAYKRISTMEVFDRIKFKIKHTRRKTQSRIHGLFLSESRNITHIDDFLSNQSYEEFFSDCDIILVPYSRKHYPCQTSGIVVEALFRNKVVIVPEDTWMSDQIRDFGSGETFISDDLESLVQAVVKVANHFHYYKERTNRNILEYRNLHSCSNLFSQMGLKGEAVEPPSRTDAVKKDSSEGLLEELMIESVVLLCEKSEKAKRIRQKNREIQVMKDSYSWKITAPFRWMVKTMNSK
jgi:glycosyltransferase involved in cell wall biosynthesis